MTMGPTPDVNPFPPRGSSSTTPAFDRTESIIDALRIKSDYLFGVPLKSSLTEDEITDSTIESYIKRAVSKIEHQVNINVSPVEYVEKHDYSLRDFENYNFIKLNHWPVNNVISVKAQYPNSIDFIEYPREWVSIYNETGLLQMTPTNGNITQFFIGGDASYIPLILGRWSKWPQLWQVTYDAGFDEKDLPSIFNHLIGCYVAIDILSMLGPVYSPITSYAINIDSVGQSAGLPGPYIFQVRVQELREEADRVLEAIKRRYNHKIQFESLGA